MPWQIMILTSSLFARPLTPGLPTMMEKLTSSLWDLCFYRKHSVLQFSASWIFSPVPPPHDMPIQTGRPSCLLTIPTQSTLLYCFITSRKKGEGVFKCPE